jgi:hypothetical protein
MEVLVVGICSSFSKNGSYTFAHIDCALDSDCKVMQRNFMIFETPVSVTVAVYIPIWYKPCHLAEVL